MFIEEIFKHYKNWLGCQVHFGYSIFFNYGTFVVNVFILNGSQNMKHLFSIQNDACCKQIYILYMWCTIDMLKFLFVMDVTVTEKNVMDATSLINFGQISIENLCIELKYKGDNVFQKHCIRLRKAFLLYPSQIFLSFCHVKKV
jgi:hypothetical protein